MVTAMPSLKDSEKLESGGALPQPIRDREGSKLVLASYNIRYAVGRFLIGSGLLRKVGISGNRKRAHQDGKNINLSAQVFSSAPLMTFPDGLGILEADK